MTYHPEALGTTLSETTPELYAIRFACLLSYHLLAETENASAAILYQARLRLQDYGKGTYRVHIPGVREDSPRLNLGDRLVLRGLYPDDKMPSDRAAEAEVVGMAKARGWVYIRSPYLRRLDAALPKIGEESHYQVEFKVSAAPVCAMQDAVSLPYPVSESC